MFQNLMEFSKGFDGEFPKSIPYCSKCHNSAFMELYTGA